MAANSSAINHVWMRLRKTAGRTWTDFGQRAWKTTQRAGAAWRRSPRVDVFETNDAVQVRVDLPGVQADAIDIKVRGRRLTIISQRAADCTDGCASRRLERPTGRFMRCVTLPSSVKDENATAQYRDGVLALSIPKRAKEAHVRVQRNSQSSSSGRSEDIRHGGDRIAVNYTTDDEGLWE